MVQFVTKQQAIEKLNIGTTTLKKYRNEGMWIEGLHWIKLNSRCIRYNLELIQDWIHNQEDPAAHQRAIDLYQARLLSNQPLPRRVPAVKPDETLRR
jgi:hypothetical protein